MFSQDGTETPPIHFGGRDELTDALDQSGVPRSEAESIATEFWAFWDTHFAAAYYAEAQTTVRAAAVIAGLFALAMGLRAVRGRLGRQPR